MLKEIFTDLLAQYTTTDHSNVLWEDIARQYSKKDRHYHTLAHLAHCYEHLCNVKAEIDDWDIVLFALFYHDYIYNPLKKKTKRKVQKHVLIY